MDTPDILVITGDGGESYEALYAVHRFEEEGWATAVAVPSRRNNHIVIEILREFDRQAKWIFGICHGVQILAGSSSINGPFVPDI